MSVTKPCLYFSRLSTCSTVWVETAIRLHSYGRGLAPAGRLPSSKPGVDKGVPVSFGGRPAAADADGAGGKVALIHGGEDGAGLHLAGRAGGTGADHDAGEVEGHHLQVRGEPRRRDAE